MTATKRDLRVQQADLIANCLTRLNQAGLLIRENTNMMRDRRKGILTIEEEFEIWSTFDKGLAFIDAACVKLRNNLRHAREGTVPKSQQSFIITRRQETARKLRKKSASQAAKDNAKKDLGED